MTDREQGIRPQMDITIPKYSNLPIEEDLPEFEQLRERVLQEKQKEVEQRVATNPLPDDEELSAGVYREDIEPQCREAVFAIRRKGYRTYSSGFGAGNTQTLDGLFDFDQATVDTLVANGYTVYDAAEGAPSILFRPNKPDMEEMTVRWNKLAELLPDLGAPAKPLTTSVEEFNRRLR